MPSMDDIAFFDTSNEIHRGGIYSETAKTEGNKLPQNRPESIKQRDQEILEHSDKKESTAPTSLDGTDVPSGLPGINLATYEKEASDINHRNADERHSQTSVPSPPASTSSKTKSWFNEKFSKESWLENLKSHNTHHQNSSLADGSASLIGKHLKKKRSGEVSVTQSETAVSPVKSETEDSSAEKLSVKSDNNVIAPSTSSSPSSISVSSKESAGTSTPSSAKDVLKASPKLLQAKDALKKLKKKKSHASDSSLKKKGHHHRSLAEDHDHDHSHDDERGHHDAHAPEVPLMKPAENLNQRMQISRSQPTVELNLANESRADEVGGDASRRRSSVTTPPKASPMMSIPGIPAERRYKSPAQSMSSGRSSREGRHGMTSSIDSSLSANDVTAAAGASNSASMSSSPSSNRSSRSEQLLTRIKSIDRASRGNDEVYKDKEKEE